MKACFGTKKVKIGKWEFEARRSLSEAANMSTGEAVELINFDLDLCRELEIRVPTALELGYLPS